MKVQNIHVTVKAICLSAAFLPNEEDERQQSGWLLAIGLTMGGICAAVETNGEVKNASQGVVRFPAFLCLPFLTGANALQVEGKTDCIAGRDDD